MADQAQGLETVLRSVASHAVVAQDPAEYGEDDGVVVGQHHGGSRHGVARPDGGLLGRGPGEGRVKDVLPDAHADFVFAVAGEEFGMLLCLFLLSVFAFIVLRGLLKLLKEQDLFIVLACTGLVTGFGLQAFVNMASTLELIPTKGMTLPFISYGGSSVVAVALGMGMLLALTRRRHPQPVAQPRQAHIAATLEDEI